MVLRVVVFLGVALSVMSVLANGSLARRVGAAAGCSVVSTSGSLEVSSCHAGWFHHAPDLRAKGCVSIGGRLWSCPVRS